VLLSLSPLPSNHTHTHTHDSYREQYKSTPAGFTYTHMSTANYTQAPPVYEDARPAHSQKRGDGAQSPLLTAADGPSNSWGDMPDGDDVDDFKVSL